MYTVGDAYIIQNMAAQPSKNVQRLINRPKALIPGGNTPEDVTQVYADNVLESALDEYVVQDPHQVDTEEVWS